MKKSLSNSLTVPPYKESATRRKKPKILSSNSVTLETNKSINNLTNSIINATVTKKVTKKNNTSNSNITSPRARTLGNSLLNLIHS